MAVRIERSEKRRPLGRIERSEIAREHTKINNKRYYSPGALPRTPPRA